MDRILDKMYQKIHGPVPQTPNGSHDTPRMRNMKWRTSEMENKEGQSPSLRSDNDFTSRLQYETIDEWNSSTFDSNSYKNNVRTVPSNKSLTGRDSRDALHSDYMSTFQPSTSRSKLYHACSEGDGETRLHVVESTSTFQGSWPHLDKYRHDAMRDLRSASPGTFYWIEIGKYTSMWYLSCI